MSCWPRSLATPAKGQGRPFVGGAPQVTNLAAKLWALHPGLTITQVKHLIVASANERKAGASPIRLMNPMRAAELAGRSLKHQTKAKGPGNRPPG